MRDQPAAVSLSKAPKSTRKPKAGNSRNSSVALGAPGDEFKAPANSLTPDSDSWIPKDLPPGPDRMSEPWIPESKLPKLPAEYAKYPFISFVRNILLRNPLFPRFYADVVLATAPNSNEAKILRPRYQKIVEKVNEKVNHMASKTCTHIKVTGVRCGSPALYGEQFCYFHQHAHRGVRKPPQSRLHPIAILEDEESIQASLMEVINALMRNTIDLKRAELILRALHIAVKNARRAKFDNDATRVVREVPEYAEPPAPPVDPTAPRKYTAQEIEALKEQILAEHRNSKQQPVPAHVAAAAPAHPRGPEATVRSAANSNPATLSTHDFKKPPQTAPQAPKERKNAAHRASGG